MFKKMFSSYSPVLEEKILAATNAQLPGTDWALNLEICDHLNNGKLASKEALEIILERLQENDRNIKLHALTLLEAIVKNCGFNCYGHVSKADFLEAIVDVAKQKHQFAEVKEKALSLLQSWGEAFKNMRDVYPNFYQIYQRLREDPSIEFPAVDTTAMAPIFTPSVSKTIQPVHATVQAKAAPAVCALGNELSPEYLDKTYSELKTTYTVLVMSREMLLVSHSEKVSPAEIARNDLLSDAVRKLRAVLSRISSILVEINGEALINVLIVVSEQIQTTLDWYKALCGGNKYALPNPVVPVLPSLIKTEENLDSKMSKEVDMLGLNDVSVDPFAELANRDSLKNNDPFKSISHREISNPLLNTLPSKPAISTGSSMAFSVQKNVLQPGEVNSPVKNSSLNNPVYLDPLPQPLNIPNPLPMPQLPPLEQSLPIPHHGHVATYPFAAYKPETYEELKVPHAFEAPIVQPGQVFYESNPFLQPTVTNPFVSTESQQRYPPILDEGMFPSVPSTIPARPVVSSSAPEPPKEKNPIVL